MPTPTGLPKVGEVWELTLKLPGQPSTSQKVVVVERGRGDYWSLRVFSYSGGTRLWVDASYHFSRGDLKYVGPAGLNTKKKLGLPC